jgi:hypothetical protein
MRLRWLYRSGLYGEKMKRENRGVSVDVAPLVYTGINSNRTPKYTDPGAAAP